MFNSWLVTYTNIHDRGRYTRSYQCDADTLDKILNDLPALGMIIVEPVLGRRAR